MDDERKSNTRKVDGQDKKTNKKEKDKEELESYEKVNYNINEPSKEVTQFIKEMGESQKVEFPEFSVASGRKNLNNIFKGDNIVSVIKDLKAANISFEKSTDENTSIEDKYDIEKALEYYDDKVKQIDNDKSLNKEDKNNQKLEIIKKRNSLQEAKEVTEKINVTKTKLENLKQKVNEKIKKYDEQITKKNKQFSNFEKNIRENREKYDEYRKAQNEAKEYYRNHKDNINIKGENYPSTDEEIKYKELWDIQKQKNNERKKSVEEVCKCYQAHKDVGCLLEARNTIVNSELERFRNTIGLTEEEKKISIIVEKNNKYSEKMQGKKETLGQEICGDLRYKYGDVNRENTRYKEIVGKEPPELEKKKIDINKEKEKENVNENIDNGIVYFDQNIANLNKGGIIKGSDGKLYTVIGQPGIANPETQITPASETSIKKGGLKPHRVVTFFTKDYKDIINFRDSDGNVNTRAVISTMFKIDKRIKKCEKKLGRARSTRTQEKYDRRLNNLRGHRSFIENSIECKEEYDRYLEILSRKNKKENKKDSKEKDNKTNKQQPGAQQPDIFIDELINGVNSNPVVYQEVENGQEAPNKNVKTPPEP